MFGKDEKENCFFATYINIKYFSHTSRVHNDLMRRLFMCSCNIDEDEPFNPNKIDSIYRGSKCCCTVFPQNAFRNRVKNGNVYSYTYNAPFKTLFSRKRMFENFAQAFYTTELEYERCN